MDFSNATHADCWDLGPPPDMILTIPPPPMPTIVASSFLTVDGNRSNNAPCPLLCDWTTGSEIEMNEELPHTGNSDEYSWFLLAISSFSIILILSMLTIFFIIKCRQNYKMKSYLQKGSYNDRTYESILYPSMKQNQVLWATLNQNGKSRTIAVTSVPPPLPPRSTYISSFENAAFPELSYFSTTSRYGRPRVSSPRCIESPNLPPLNYYPTLKRHKFPPLL